MSSWLWVLKRSRYWLSNYIITWIISEINYCFSFQTVSRLSPKLVALHCQEVGGKNYERSMQHVSEFVKWIIFLNFNVLLYIYNFLVILSNLSMLYFRLLMSSEELQLFDKVRIFLDEDYSSAEHFTVSIDCFCSFIVCFLTVMYIFISCLLTEIGLPSNALIIA